MIHLARRGAIEYLEDAGLAAHPFLTHGFCTRRGGVSEGPFASLNTGEQVGDRAKDVRRNLSAIGEAFAIPEGRLVLMQQVHGDRIEVIDDNGCPADPVPECDGLVTDCPGVALAVKTADCVPILFADPVRRAIGVAHAGWRGTALGIAGKLARLFQERYSSRLEDLLVAIGPAIGPCCYQVDGPVREAFAARPEASRLLRPCPEQAGRWRLDLPLANRLELTALGIPTENISLAGQCTACRTDLFFSHRAEQGRTGRQISFLMAAGKNA
ncbi:MAG: peptidoglycan editing factor PgeF [Deltaproteobacteria bacterium]|nr:peptidoglycan editing factor PgeF [Deltaproteobacteria bacterium]